MYIYKISPEGTENTQEQRMQYAAKVLEIQSRNSQHPKEVDTEQLLVPKMHVSVGETKCRQLNQLELITADDVSVLTSR